jgi:hypothetical protein
MAIFWERLSSAWKRCVFEYTIVPEYGNVGGFEVMRLHSEVVEVERKALCRSVIPTGKGNQVGPGKSRCELGR